MSVQPIGDSLVLAKLAYDFYRKGYQVAKHAPEEFSELLEELRRSRDVFWWIQNTIKANDSVPVQAALKRCMGVLEEDFKPLVKKFEKLASTDRGIFFKRVQFAVGKREITSCQKKLEYSKKELHFILTAHSIVRPRSPKFSPTGSVGRDQGITSGPFPIPDGEIDDSDADSFKSAASQGVEEQEQLDNVSEIPALSQSAGGQPQLEHVSTRDFSECAGNSDAAAYRMFNSDPPDAKQWRGIKSHAVTSSTLNELQTPSSKRLTRASQSSKGSRTGSSVIRTERPSSTKDSAVAFGPAERAARNDKIFILRRNHLKHSLMQRALYGPAELEEAFEEESKLPETDMGIGSWLLIAVWWYLKSRILWDILAPGYSESSKRTRSSYWPCTISVVQTNIDLMKSDFILRRMVLARLAIGDKITESQWATIQDLADNIRAEQRRRELNPKALDETELPDPDFAFAESFSQPVEDPNTTSDGMDVPQAIDNLDPVEKWLTMEQDRAGNRRKEVIWRGFVNAEIGNQDVGRRSPSAPYLLVLSSPKGSSDLMVSLINQRNTVSLARSMTSDDIQAYEEDNGLITTFPFNFPSQEAIIEFLSKEEIDKFLERPRKFFAATRERNPLPKEFLVFRETADAFNDLKPDHFSQPKSTGEKFNHMESGPIVPAIRVRSFCEVSLYALMPDDCWKTTRRLVICSSPDEPNPWCVSFWLPLSDLNVGIASRDVKLEWSDFKNHETKPSGDFWFFHSFKYNPEEPNREMHLSFQSSEASEAFASCLLNPFHSPFEMQEHVKNLAEFESSSVGRELIVYQLRNLNADQVGYHAIVTIDKGPNSHFRSQVFFVFRDIDYKLDTVIEMSVEIGNLIVPNYISTMQEMEEFPQDGEGPQLKDTTYLSKRAGFVFDSFEELELFAKHLTGWNLKLHCRAKSLTISHRIIDRKSLKDVAICLWEKIKVSDGISTELRMTGRTIKGNEPWWTTVKLDGTDRIEKHQGRVVIVGKIDVQFGTKVDCLDMEAVRPSKSQQNASWRGKLKLSFEDEKFARYFVKHNSMPARDWIPLPLVRRPTQGTFETPGMPSSRRPPQENLEDVPPDWPAQQPARQRTNDSSGFSRIHEQSSVDSAAFSPIERATSGTSMV